MSERSRSMYLMALEEFWQAVHEMWRCQAALGRLHRRGAPPAERVRVDQALAAAMRRVEAADDYLHTLTATAAATRRTTLLTTATPALHGAPGLPGVRQGAENGPPAP